MIRLIASDLDGTMLQNGAQKLSEDALLLIEQIKDLGIYFVAASGRQYGNMKRLFGPLWEDVFFVAENGSLIVHRDEVLDQTVISPGLARDLIRELYRDSRCDVVASGARSLYLRPKPGSRPHVDHLIYDLKNTVTIVEDFDHIHEDIIKISALAYDNRAHDLGKDLIPKWSGRFHVAVAGKQWLDFTLTNKGEAIRKLCSRLNLERDELAAFGDNFNDESMFRSVRYSYAMNGARDEVRQMARHCCDSVETVLHNLVSYYT